jgi:hypothetical protein
MQVDYIQLVILVFIVVIHGGVGFVPIHDHDRDYVNSIIFVFVVVAAVEGFI